MSYAMNPSTVANLMAYGLIAQRDYLQPFGITVADEATLDDLTKALGQVLKREVLRLFDIKVD